MKKSIKRLLFLTQVLGWSALAATACTKNASEAKPSETTAKTNNTDDKKTEESKNPTTVTLADPIKLTPEEETKVRGELTKSLFNESNFEKMATGTYNSNNEEVKGLVDKFPVTIENDQGKATIADEKVATALKDYKEAIFSGTFSNNNIVSSASNIDPNKKSIDGVNGPLDPKQSAPLVATEKKAK